MSMDREGKELKHQKMFFAESLLRKWKQQAGHLLESYFKWGLF